MIGDSTIMHPPEADYETHQAERQEWLFISGLIGTGMLGVPVLAGACAGTIAEAFA